MQIRSMVTGDKAFKEASSFYNQVMKKIDPDVVPDKYDEITGELVEMPGYYNTGIPVIKAGNDPIRNELQRLGAYIPLPSKWLTDNIELNDKQLAEKIRLTGTLPNPEYGNLRLKQALTALILSPKYQQGLSEEGPLIEGYADDDPRLREVKELIYSYRDLAEQVLLAMPENFELEQRKTMEDYKEKLLQRGVPSSALELTE
jgi:hypothetical protein